MKLISTFIISLLILQAQHQTTETITLRVTVTNIKKIKGSIMVGVFNNQNGFLEKSSAIKNVSQKVTDNSLTIILNNIKKGDYSLAIYHDVNSDNKCNKNFLGIPVEPYGFSKNHKPVLSKPTFDDCKIDLNADKSITIKLID